MDIEEVNSEPNTVTYFSNGEKAYGDFGFVWLVGEWVEFYPPEHVGQGFFMRPVEAKALAAALLELTKDHK